MGDGERLVDVLIACRSQAISGTPVTAEKQGSSIRILPDGSTSPLRVQIDQQRRPEGGGQAAVAMCRAASMYRDYRATPSNPGGEPMALRVEYFQGNFKDPRRAAITLAGALSRTSHARYPALLKVHQTFITTLSGSQVICDVSEWCTPLKDVAEMSALGQGYPHDKALELWVPLAETMHHLHEDYGWVHRDIDETNILRSADGTLKIADIGIVSTIPDFATHKYTALVGKNFNYPPEGWAARLQERPLTVRKSYDAWQLGRILYMLLTGDAARTPLVDGSGLIMDPTVQWQQWQKIRDRTTMRVLKGLLDPNPDQRMTLKDAVTELKIPTDPILCAQRELQNEIDQLRPLAQRNGLVRMRQLDYLEKLLEEETKAEQQSRSEHRKSAPSTPPLNKTTTSLENWRENSQRTLSDISIGDWFWCLGSLLLIGAIPLIAASSWVSWLSGHRTGTNALVALLSLFAAFPVLSLWEYWYLSWTDREPFAPWGEAGMHGTFTRSADFRYTRSWWAETVAPWIVVSLGILAGVVVGLWLGAGQPEWFGGTDDWICSHLSWLLKCTN